MEKTESGVMVPLDAGWSDIGSWDALWQIGKKDNEKNVVHGDVLIKDVKNSFFHADNRLIAAVGLENHIVVETTDAVLISPRNRVQDVKQLVEKLKEKKREEAVCHRKVFRPWGSYETIDTSERFQVKRLTIKPGGKLSLQKHNHRSEHWVVVTGTASVTKGDEKFILSEDESTFIPVGVPHRLENKENIALQIIEVRTGNFLGEEDIVRIDDAYGR
jgi:mannose-1-phosphate guanylyltransferase/mannose-6-phosphate isomerase